VFFLSNRRGDKDDAVISPSAAAVESPDSAESWQIHFGMKWKPGLIVHIEETGRRWIPHSTPKKIVQKKIRLLTTADRQDQNRRSPQDILRVRGKRECVIMIDGHERWSGFSGVGVEKEKRDERHAGLFETNDILTTRSGNLPNAQESSDHNASASTGQAIIQRSCQIRKEEARRTGLSQSAVFGLSPESPIRKLKRLNNHSRDGSDQKVSA
jgi:hypothetical protein